MKELTLLKIISFMWVLCLVVSSAFIYLSNQKPTSITYFLLAVLITNIITSIYDFVMVKRRQKKS